jgi:hypothetical protein
MVYTITSGWTIAWFLLLRAWWAGFESSEAEYRESPGEVFGLWEVLGYVLFTLVFAQVGHILLMALLMLPVPLTFFLVVWCTSCCCQ